VTLQNRIFTEYACWVVLKLQKEQHLCWHNWTSHCIGCTFNSSLAAGIWAPYGHECVWRCYKVRIPLP